MSAQAGRWPGPESIEATESTARIRPGKNARSRVRCTGCHALVLTEAVDVAGLCDSCNIQRGLFAVKSFKRRRFTGNRSGRRSGGSSGFGSSSSARAAARRAGGRRGRR